MAKSKQKKSRNNYDSPWKMVIEKYFQLFLEYYFPKVRDAIDWSVVPEFLDTELPKILSLIRDESIYADKLVKVRRNSGEDSLIFVHVEVQANADPNFPYRMFQYNVRIHERFMSHSGTLVTSLAVLADDNPNWRPSEFMRAGLGTELIFRYPAVKLLDKATGCEEFLQKEKNPFAWITKAHCDALATNKNESERYLRKKEMARLLYRGGFSKEVVHDIVWFFDWVLWLPEEYDSSFRLYLGELEDEMGKQYVPSWERLAVREALQKGREETLSANIAKVLEKRLNGGSQPYIANIAHLSESERDELFDLLIDTTDTEKIKAWFAAHPGKKTSGN